MLSRERFPTSGGVVLARMPELVGALVGAGVGLARSSFGAGFVAFVIVSLGLELGLDLRERILIRSPSKFAKVVESHLRGAGIEPRSDRADLSRPLSSWSGEQQPGPKSLVPMVAYWRKEPQRDDGAWRDFSAR
jgi:hypothetical protein